MPTLRFTDISDHLLRSCETCHATVSLSHYTDHLVWHSTLTPDAEAEPGVTITPGTPGTIDGIAAHDLATIGDLNDLALDLGDAWPTGSYIEYGDNHRKAHWTGAKFASGVAA